MKSCQNTFVRKRFFIFLYYEKAMKLVYCCLFVVLLSCSDKSKKDTPADLLPKEAMAIVMADLSLAESVINMNMAAKAAEQNTDTTRRFNVYKEHNISRSQYESSLRYYSAHPDEFKQVYELVVKKLEQMKK